MRTRRLLVLLAAAAALAACSPTPVYFDGPPGTVIFVNDQPYHLPTRIEFVRPAGRGDHTRYDISLVFKLPQTGEVRAVGTMDVYGYTESDVDKLVTNQIRLSEDELTNLANGQPTVYKSVTASKQPLFDLNLHRQ